MINTTKYNYKIKQIDDINISADKINDNSLFNNSKYSDYKENKLLINNKHILKEKISNLKKANLRFEKENSSCFTNKNISCQKSKVSNIKNITYVR